MAVTDTDVRTLRSALRQQPYLTREDSIYRAIEMLRHSGCDTLPLLDARQALVGVVTAADLRPLLGNAAGADRLADAVLPLAHRPGCVGTSEMSLDEARAALTTSGDTTLMIVDRWNRYVGSVSLVDILGPQTHRIRPSSAGGMATPWGVHLNTGTLQAGSGPLELAAGGATLGVLMVGAYALIALAAFVVQRTTPVQAFAFWLGPAPSQLWWQAPAWYAMHAAVAPLFLMMLRLLPLTGYHAAEHQAVHALERGEPLHPAVVKRMPRVHPRCGTNLMAGGLVFASVSQAIGALSVWGLDATDGAVIGGIAALFTWRSIGAFLQQYITTRPANDRQIAAGIAAALELERKYMLEMPAHPTLIRRLWSAGMAPTLIGAAAGSAAAMGAWYWILVALVDRAS